MTEAYMCECGQRIKKLYEVCSATWMKDVFDDKDEGSIDHYGDTHYTWECSDKDCHSGGDWGMEMPAEWPHCVETEEGCTTYAVIVNDETDNGYCESCVNWLADNGHEEGIFMKKLLEQEASQ
jgi:hypothetical protein